MNGGNIKRRDPTPPIVLARARSEEKLSRLGITDELDLLMHLPLRYEDETHLYPIRDIPAEKTVQVEGVIIHSEIMFRPRRQLVCQVDDGSGVLSCAFSIFMAAR